MLQWWCPLGPRVDPPSGDNTAVPSAIGIVSGFESSAIGIVSGFESSAIGLVSCFESIKGCSLPNILEMTLFEASNSSKP